MFKRHRVQVDFSSPAYESMLALKEAANCTTKALFSRALKLFGWYMAQKIENKKIVTIDTKGNAKEIEFIF